MLEALSGEARVLCEPGDVPGSVSNWLANRMLREFKAEDDIAGIALQGVVLEILAESARAIGKASGKSAEPAWLKRVREALEDCYLEAPSLGELAAIGGVHPVHLSREFRKHHQVTISEYIRIRRIDHASHLLAHSQLTLSEIARTCGFTDQSHFCSSFKSRIGLTPAKYRAVATFH
jgi:AraC-like DNA-binding protein